MKCVLGRVRESLRKVKNLKNSRECGNVPKNINSSSKLQFDEKIVKNLKIRVLPVISADIAKTMVAILIAILMKLVNFTQSNGLKSGFDVGRSVKRRSAARIKDGRVIIT